MALACKGLKLDINSLSPDTTHQEDITTAGQRRINLLWEWTQSVISITVVFSTMAVGAYQVISGSKEQIPTIFSGAFFGVIGFYFSRTNHEKIGGIGKREDQKYIGR